MQPPRHGPNTQLRCCTWGVLDGKRNHKTLRQSGTTLASPKHRNPRKSAAFQIAKVQIASFAADAAKISYNQKNRRVFCAGARKYPPPPPESKIELWVPKSTVDTQNLENHVYHSLRRIGPKFGPRNCGSYSKTVLSYQWWTRAFPRLQNRSVFGVPTWCDN